MLVFFSLFQPDLYTGSRRLLFKINSFLSSRAPITANRMTTTECRANEILNRWCEFICEQRWHTIVPRTSTKSVRLRSPFLHLYPQRGTPPRASIVRKRQDLRKPSPSFQASSLKRWRDGHSIYKIVRRQFYARFLFFISTRSLYREPKAFIQK